MAAAHSAMPPGDCWSCAVNKRLSKAVICLRCAGESGASKASSSVRYWPKASDTVQAQGRQGHDDAASIIRTGGSRQQTGLL